MIHDAPNVNYLFAGLLVEELVRHGVEWFVVSPGSRSAPLAWTAASHPRAKTVVHFDERGAAFHALGIAKATLKPAAFICTSGTAAANALPAAVEACYSGIPLILLTADRPERLRGSGANQTINQHGLYREFVRDEKNFAVSAEDFDASEALAAIDEAVDRATDTWPGPIHLNCQFDEPLTPETSAEAAFDRDESLRSVSEWIRSGLPHSQRPDANSEIDEGSLRQLREILSNPTPGLVLVGQLSGPRERDEVRGTLERLQWPYIPDITSGLRLGPPLASAMSFVNHYAGDIFDRARTLIHVGGPMTSRRLLDPVSRFDTSDGQREFIRISPSPEVLDPHGNLTLRVRASLATLRDALPRSDGSPASFDRGVMEADSDTRIFNALCEAIPATDPATEIGAVLSLTFEPARRWAVFAGNSMPIRDLDLYGLVNLNGPTWVVANRGASGIDGNIATAAGHSRATGEPVVALLGDLAVLHDLNSLALLRDLPAPVVIVVLNNDGGGIFSFLPIAKYTGHFERLFGTPHGRDFSHAAELFGLAYFRPKTNMEIGVRVVEAIDRRQSCIIEVVSNREENKRQHRELDAKIRAALDKA